METKQQVEICTIDDIGLVITGADAPPLIEAINEYLSIFAKPVRRKGGGNISGKINCFNCNEPLDGVLGSFTWGIIHGEGNCGKCGWPCRAYHKPKDHDGDIFDGPLNTILQYHPNAEKGDDGDHQTQ